MPGGATGSEGTALSLLSSAEVAARLESPAWTTPCCPTPPCLSFPQTKANAERGLRSGAANRQPGEGWGLGLGFLPCCGGGWGRACGPARCWLCGR